MTQTGLRGFSPEALRGVVAANAKEDAWRKTARAVKVKTRHMMRRARSEAVLAEILPAVFDADCSYHVISHGDIDALSYLKHIVNAGPLTYVSISTWCMAMPDIEEVAGWLDRGLIEVVDWYVGEIFPNQYGDEMARLQKVVQIYGGRLVVARNHSKVMLCANESIGFYAVVESSANVNTNPRIEQAAIHTSHDLYAFYREFFDGLVSIHGERDTGRVRAHARSVAAGD